MFLNGGDALSGLGDAEGEHGEVVVVEQHHAVVEDVNFFAHIFQIGPQSDGGIRLLDIEEGVSTKSGQKSYIYENEMDDL